MEELILPVEIDGDDTTHPDNVIMANGDIVSYDYENELEIALSDEEDPTQSRGPISEVYVFLDKENASVPRPGDDAYPFTNRLMDTKLHNFFADLVSIYTE